MVGERGSPLRVIIDNFQGPKSYQTGGFVGTPAIGVPYFGSNVGISGAYGSNITQMRSVTDAMGQGLALISGANTSNLTSGLLYVVQSAGISGNQIGIRCFNPIAALLSGIEPVVNFTQISGGNSQIAEVQSGADLSPYTFKVIVQGF